MASQLEKDEECTFCFMSLTKGTQYYRKFVNEDGEIVYECERCSMINEIERNELKRIVEISEKDMGMGISAFESDHKKMIAMSEMDSSLNGMADFESWMSAAAEVMKPDATADSGCGEVKTLNILPDKDMAEKIKHMQDESIAEMEKAKSEWADKSEHFLSPSDMDFIHGDGVHGPDSLSYQDWRSASVRVPVPRDGVSADSELGSLRSRWLHPVHVGIPRHEGGAASGGAAASGGSGAPAEPPSVSSGGAAASGGAGAASSEDDVQMSARQMWLLGLMDN